MQVNVREADVQLQVNLPSWVNFPDFERVGWLNSVMGMQAGPVIVH